MKEDVRQTINLRQEKGYRRHKTGYGKQTGNMRQETVGRRRYKVDMRQVTGDMRKETENTETGDVA